MKKLILILCLASSVSELSSGPIAIYGRPRISGNSVNCLGGRRLCAVIPRSDETGPANSEGVISIYNESGEIMEQHTYSSITIQEESGGTLVSWLP